MRVIKGLLLFLGGVILLAALLFGAGSAWLSQNADTVAEAAVNASGIKDEIANQRRERCARARAAFDQMWDDAVDSNRQQERASALESAEADMKAVCAEK